MSSSHLDGIIVYSSQYPASARPHTEFSRRKTRFASYYVQKCPYFVVLGERKRKKMYDNDGSKPTA